MQTMPLNFRSDSGGKNLLCVYQKIVSQNMRRAGKTFSCALLFIYPLFKKRTVPLGENSYKHNYFLDGKQEKGRFDIPDLYRSS